MCHFILAKWSVSCFPLKWFLRLWFHLLLSPYCHLTHKCYHFFLILKIRGTWLLLLWNRCARNKQAFKFGSLRTLGGIHCACIVQQALTTHALGATYSCWNANVHTSRVYHVRLMLIFFKEYLLSLLSCRLWSRHRLLVANKRDKISVLMKFIF